MEAKAAASGIWVESLSEMLQPLAFSSCALTQRIGKRISVLKRFLSHSSADFTLGAGFNKKLPV